MIPDRTAEEWAALIRLGQQVRESQRVTTGYLGMDMDVIDVFVGKEHFAVIPLTPIGVHSANVQRSPSEGVLAGVTLPRDWFYTHDIVELSQLYLSLLERA